MSESKPEIKLEDVTLKHVSPPEVKNVLPSAQDIEIEKQHITFVNGVESFDKKQLKPTVTQEKFVLPDKDGKFFLDFFFSILNSDFYYFSF